MIAIPKDNYSIQTQHLRYALPCSIYRILPMCKITSEKSLWGLGCGFLWWSLFFCYFCQFYIFCQGTYDHLISAISNCSADLREVPGIIHTHDNQWKNSLCFQWVGDQSSGLSTPLCTIYLTKIRCCAISVLGNPRSKDFRSFLPSECRKKNGKFITSVCTAKPHFCETSKRILELWVS